MAITGTAAETAERGDPGLSWFHLYGLRLVFALMALFLLGTVAPQLPVSPPTMMSGVARAFMTALGLLAVLGVRYPAQMLPIMMFELVWKLLWLAFIGLPLWMAHRLDEANSETFLNVTVGIPLVLIVFPYAYAFRNYVKRRGDPWQARKAG